MRRSIARLVVLVQLSGLGAAAPALAVSDAALRCQSVIGDAGRTFATTRLNALVACSNARASGGMCKTLRRDRLVGTAARALVERIVGACGTIALGELDFPGVCSDATGGSFDLPDLTPCLVNAHVAATDVAIRTDYPGGGPFVGEARRCQRGLGRAASTFVAASLRARTRCLDVRQRGALPQTVDCRAAVAPFGPGTDDAATDDAIQQATKRLFDRINDACWRTDLADLGFPGSCPEPLPGDALDPGYVAHCVRTTHESLAVQMLTAEYPPTATPSPAPTATPALVSLELLPTSPQKPVGAFQNFTTRGDFADGSARNVTQRVDYFSSDPSVAFCPNAPGNRSRTDALGVGTALITARDPVTGITSAPVTFTVVACNRCAPSPNPLAVICDPCVATICAADPSCCTTAWTQACVDRVTPMCGESCPTPP